MAHYHGTVAETNVNQSYLSERTDCSFDLHTHERDTVTKIEDS